MARRVRSRLGEHLFHRFVENKKILVLGFLTQLANHDFLKAIDNNHDQNMFVSVGKSDNQGMVLVHEVLLAQTNRAEARRKRFEVEQNALGRISDGARSIRFAA